MSHRPIIDAGPGLNFLSINKEGLLISVLGPLSAPEAVQDEVFRKARLDERFKTAEKVWRRLTPRWMQVLSDDPTPALAAVVHRITRQPFEQRRTQSKDLGEVMVIAHAVVAAESGDTVTILIDDGQGARLAAVEMGRLDRLRSGNPAVGSIRLASTLTVLKRAALKRDIAGRNAMRNLYTRLRALDDGLVPIEKSGLLSTDLWT